MEVDDFELLELVNDYQERSDEPTFNTLDDIPVDECIRRDAMRPNPIGEKVIKATWRRYRDFIIQEDIKSMLKRAPKHVDGGRPVILVDMDATLCLNTTGRPYFGEGRGRLWSEIYWLCI